MKIFICSDTHFNHFNIIQYCGRPFTQVMQMNAAIIERWNATVTDSDIVLFLGDFCMSRMADAQKQTKMFTSVLRGRKIIVKGNHDFNKFDYKQAGFEYACRQELVVGNVLFCHNPHQLSLWCKKYRHVYYGYVHNKVIANAPINSTNVSIDVLNYTPLDITTALTAQEVEIIKKLAKGEKNV